MDKIPYHQLVANKIIEELKKGTAPWLKPWEAGTQGHLPINPLTGKRYRGINALYLMMQNQADNRWLTYKQAQSLGAQVRKGEKSTLIQYWKFEEEKIQKDEKGNELKVKVKLERPQVFYASVFNATQMDSMPPLEYKEPNWSLHEKAESILAKSGAKIFHQDMDRAFYRPSSDSIHLPLKSQFKSEALYYATALHELAHWSGHKSRLARDLGHPFGSEAYAKEELRAEIASLILGEELGIGHDPSQHMAYIKSWIRVLEEEPLEIFRASSDAEKITNFINSLSQEQKQVLEAPINEGQNIKTLVSEKTWLAIPYEQKDKVKSIVGFLPDGKPGIAWDKAQKCWYANPGVSLDSIKPWLIETPSKIQPGIDPSTEFKEALISLGCIITDNHPIMDGQKHRIATDGDKKGEKAGFYVAHLDGHPAGYIKNNRTGAELKWKSKGYVLSDEEKARFKALALEKSKIRAAELDAMHKKTAEKLRQKLTLLQPLSEPTPYIEKKGIQVHAGIYTDEKQKTACIPAMDKDGIVWTIQYIMEDGIKRFAKDSRKEGCFHILGDGSLACLAKSPVIIIAEGYATAASLKEALDMPVVCAFDAGNLKAVAQGIKEKCPNTPILIAADDDKHLELTQGINSGKEMAYRAAEAVKGHVIIPIFAPGEQSQHPKKFTDFNDLAKNSALGLRGVKNQVIPVIKRIISQNQVICQGKANRVSHLA